MHAAFPRWIATENLSTVDFDWLQKFRVRSLREVPFLDLTHRMGDDGNEVDTSSRASQIVLIAKSVQKFVLTYGAQPSFILFITEFVQTWLMYSNVEKKEIIKLLIKRAITPITWHRLLAELKWVNLNVQEFAADLDFRQSWIDPRLVFNTTEPDMPVYIPHHSIDKFWIPDIYFPNENSGTTHQITLPNKSIRIYANGTVRYFSRCDLLIFIIVHDIPKVWQSSTHMCAHARTPGRTTHANNTAHSANTTHGGLYLAGWPHK